MTGDVAVRYFLDIYTPFGALGKEGRFCSMLPKGGERVAFVISKVTRQTLSIEIF